KTNRPEMFGRRRVSEARRRRNGPAGAAGGAIRPRGLDEGVNEVRGRSLYVNAAADQSFAALKLLTRYLDTGLAHLLERRFQAVAHHQILDVSRLTAGFQKQLMDRMLRARHHHFLEQVQKPGFAIA